MWEYFRGWQRKFGVLILLVACGGMGLWLRSLSTADLVTWYTTNKTYVLVSGQGQCLLLLADPSYLAFQVPGIRGVTIPSMSIRIRPMEYERVVKRGEVNRLTAHSWQSPKVEVRSALEPTSPSDSDKVHTMVAYSTIVIPLTVTSLWLLVLNPRKSRSNRASADHERALL